MVGNDPSGNINDVVYGHQGDDTITTQHGLFNSTVFGGQGDDSITDVAKFGSSHQIGGNVIYGNLGNDVIKTSDALTDTFYGGQGSDSLFAASSTATVFYGNQGNDVLAGRDNINDTYFGGRGDDTIIVREEQGPFSGAQIYGNQGNDVLVGRAIDDAVMYGGQGNDFLRFTGDDPKDSLKGFTFNDVEIGGVGDDTFAADNGSAGNTHGALLASDIVTVVDYLQGNDKLTETSESSIPLDKIALAAATKTGALTAANNFYNTHAASEYVFVYGGSGAGFLFYNGDGGGKVATAGMAIEGATAAGDVTPNDIVARAAHPIADNG